MTGVLADRAVISVAGPEAKSFLQGLITNDVRSVTPDAPLYAALLTPQGKILFDFLLTEQHGTVLIDCQAPSADALLRRLSLYRLRAKVELARRDELAVLWNATGQGVVDPRLAALGRRMIAASQGPDAVAEYLGLRLALGVPEGADFGSDKMFALDGGLEELHAVSFEKGCYIGQELTARMKHRGTARKRLLPVSTEAGTELPPPGTEIRSSTLALGEITSTYGARGFAIVRLDRLEEADPANVWAAGAKLRISKPEWLASGSAS